MIFEAGILGASMLSGQNNIIESPSGEIEYACLLFNYTVAVLRLDNVLNIVDNTQSPPTEVIGDRYIIDNTGVTNPLWDGASANDIVEYDGATWQSTTPANENYSLATTPNQDYIFTTADGWNAGTPQPKLAYIYVNAPLPDPIPTGETHVELDINDVKEWIGDNADFDGYYVDIQGDNNLDFDGSGDLLVIDAEIKWYGSNGANIIVQNDNIGIGTYQFSAYDSSVFCFYNKVTFTREEVSSSIDGFYYSDMQFGISADNFKTSFCQCKINLDIDVSVDRSSFDTFYSGSVVKIDGVSTMVGCRINCNVSLRATDGFYSGTSRYDGQASVFALFSDSASQSMVFDACKINQDLLLLGGDGIEGEAGVTARNMGTEGGEVSYGVGGIISTHNGSSSTQVIISSGDGGNGAGGQGSSVVGGDGGDGGAITCATSIPLSDSANIVCNIGIAGSGGTGLSRETTGTFITGGNGGASGSSYADVSILSLSKAVIEVNGSNNFAGGTGGTGVTTSSTGIAIGGFGGEGGDVNVLIDAIDNGASDDVEIELNVNILKASNGGNGGSGSGGDDARGGDGGNGGDINYTRTIEVVDKYELVDSVEVIGDAGSGGAGGSGAQSPGSSGSDGTRTVSQT